MMMDNVVIGSEQSNCARNEGIHDYDEIVLRPFARRVAMAVRLIQGRVFEDDAVLKNRWPASYRASGFEVR
jgi:hypothetical protein